MNIMPEALKNRRVHLHSRLVGYYVSRSYVSPSIHIFYTNQTPFNPSKIDIYRKINFFITSHQKQTFCNTYRNRHSLIATPRKQRVYYPKISTIENHPYKPHQNNNHNPLYFRRFLIPQNFADMVFRIMNQQITREICVINYSEFM